MNATTAIRRRTLLAGGLAASVGAGALAHAANAGARARVGMALPLSGVQAGVGQELLWGYQMAFNAARQRGLEVLPEIVDDKGQAANTAQAIAAFGRDKAIVASTGLVGTPHAKAAIPEARLYGLPIVGLRSGAAELRDGGPLVYHLRASFESELGRMVGNWSAAQSRIAIVASDDAFGIPAARHAQAVAKQRGLSVVNTVMTERSGSKIREAVAAVVQPDVHADVLLLLTITKPTIEAIRAARAAPWMGPICAMSFVAGRELADAGPDVYRGLGLVSAFPVPRAAPDAMSGAYRAAASAAGKPELIESITAAEGFWYGTALSEALLRVSERITRQSLVDTLDASPPLRLGGESMPFDKSRVARQYLQVVVYDGRGFLRS